MFRVGGTGTGAPPTQKEMEEAERSQRKDVRKNVMIFVFTCIALKGIAFVCEQMTD